MDLKVVCLLFGCLLSIALAQGEEKDGDGGSQEKATSEECKCDRRPGGRGPGERGPGEHGPRRWGRHGGKDGEKKCPVFTRMFRDCDKMTEQLCDYIDENKEDMKKCWKRDGNSDDKRDCMVEFMTTAIKSFGEEDFTDCITAVTNMIDPK